MKKPSKQQFKDHDTHALVARAIRCVNEKSHGMPMALDIAYRDKETAEFLG
ncbi:MAG: hypothetical protein AB8B64_18435 [Granulosicoccus sp.]